MVFNTIITFVLLLMMVIPAQGMGLGFGGGQGGGNSLPDTTPLGYISINRGATARLAVDGEGYIYVCIPSEKKVEVFSNNGLLVSTIEGIKRPISVAVKEDLLFIGDAGSGSVDVYSRAGEKLYALGSGDGEFAFPGDIATTTDRVYVTDSRADSVKVYSISGRYLFSLGTGLFSFPTGIAVDETQMKVYVADHNNSLIRVFDLDGNNIMDIDGEGKILRPQGIALDADRIYLTDSYHSAVAIFGRAGGFQGYIGDYGKGPGELRIPLDAAFDIAEKLFVSNNNNQRIEVFGVNGFNYLTLTPSVINLTGFSNGDPLSAEITLESERPATWTIHKNAAWISFNQELGSTPAKIILTADPAGLEPGHYSEDVRFRLADGITSVLRVTLEVKNPGGISVVPATVSFTYQINSADLPSANLFIQSEGSAVGWSSSSNVTWLTVLPDTGTTPATLTVSLNGNVLKLPEGDYSGGVTIDAGNVSGSPAVISIHLSVKRTGTITVKTNLPQSSFTIEGPEDYSGGGLVWSADDVPPGRYSVVFQDIPGYSTPPARSITIRSGRETTVEGIYHENAVSNGINGIVFLTDDGYANIYSNDGSPVNRFRINWKGKKVVTGDVDGDGTDEIIVLSRRLIATAYEPDGSIIGYITIKKSLILDIRMEDINSDGKDEVVLLIKRRGKKTDSTVSAFRYQDMRFSKISTLLRTSSPAKGFVFCDLNGDGSPEVVTSNKRRITAYYNDGSKRSLYAERDARIFDVECGDMEEGGAQELAFSLRRHKRAPFEIAVLKGNGDEVTVFNRPERVPFDVSDINDDGRDEILIPLRGGDQLSVMTLDPAGIQTEIFSTDIRHIIDFAAGRF